jgi:hypothetical protein
MSSVTNTSRCHISLSHLPLFFSKALVVYVADDPVRAKEAESILKFMGYANVQCYLAGMRDWEQVGGLIKYPKFVNFAVSQTYWWGRTIT